MTESDARMLAFASQAHTVLVTECALVIIEVCMTLDDQEKGEERTAVVKVFILTTDRQVCPQESLKSHGSRQPPVRV
jgi:hypothetical protein